MERTMPMAVDVIAQAIRTNPRTLAAGELAERYVAALVRAGYVVTPAQNVPERWQPPSDSIRTAARITLKRLWNCGVSMTTADHALLNHCLSALEDAAAPAPDSAAPTAA